MRAAVQVLINAAILGFGWIMLVYGIPFVQAFGGDFMESIPFTNVWYYTALPVSGALIMLYSLRDQLNACFGPERRLEDDPATAPPDQRDRAMTIVILFGGVRRAAADRHRLGGRRDQHLVRLSEVAVGRLPGGLAQINLLSSMLFGGVSGSGSPTCPRSARP